MLFHGSGVDLRGVLSRASLNFASIFATRNTSREADFACGHA